MVLVIVRRKLPLLGVPVISCVCCEPPFDSVDNRYLDENPLWVGQIVRYTVGNAGNYYVVAFC